MQSAKRKMQNFGTALRLYPPSVIFCENDSSITRLPAQTALIRHPLDARAPQGGEPNLGKTGIISIIYFIMIKNGTPSRRPLLYNYFLFVIIFLAVASPTVATMPATAPLIIGIAATKLFGA